MVVNKKYSAIIGVIGLVSILLLFGLMRYQELYTMHHAILEDLAILQEVMQKIDEECHIISVDKGASPINFLNIQSFVGSEVGPLNFQYPEKWQGPYMKDNPTVQGIDYQIVQTQDGVFIMPGNGVVLSNGMMIGRDIIINSEVNVKALMHDSHGLMYKGDSFALQILQRHNKIPDEESALFEMIEED